MSFRRYLHVVSGPASNHTGTSASTVTPVPKPRKVAVDLPQELLNEIISYIPQNDIRSLRSCSLVARSWVYPSRRYLFHTVHVERTNTFRSWLNNISPLNLELLQHIRSLYCENADSFAPRHGHTNRVGFLTYYSPSLHELRNLWLTSRHLSFDQIGTPCGFQHTLTDLGLVDCGVTISTLVTLVNYFSNLVHLYLIELKHEEDNQPVPPLSRPLRKLTIGDLHPDHGLSLLDLLSSLCPQCDEVTLMSFLPCPSLAQRVVNGVETSLKCLDLQKELKCIADPLTLTNCRELRELKICASPPDTMEHELISSITSTNIEKITLTLSHGFYRFLPDHRYWRLLDNSLCQLVDRLGCGGQLIVEIQTYDFGGGMEYGEYLPKFHEKGQVRVVDEASDSIIYCSKKRKTRRGRE